jgi:hypothetical protein
MATWTLQVAGETWRVNVRDEQIVALPPAPGAPTVSPRELVKASLEQPVNFEPLRRALTPDDHICIVLDERLPHLAEMIAGVLDHLATAGIDPDAVTLLSPETNSKQTWIDDLPDEFADVKTEMHHPADRKKLAYLATTKSGERIYLNRTAVEADFVIVLCAHRHDDRPGEAWLVPGLCDEEHQKRAAASPHDESESIWLLGTPFFVRVIEGAGGGIDEVLSGFTDTNAKADERRAARWNHSVSVQPQTVVVSSPSNRFDDLVAVVASAERVVAPGGRIIATMAEAPIFPEAVEVLRTSGDLAVAAERLTEVQPEGLRTALQWVETATHAAIFLAGPLPAEVCEELFATAIGSTEELQRLLDGGDRMMKLDDAHLAQVDYIAKGSAK